MGARATARTAGLEGREIELVVRYARRYVGLLTVGRRYGVIAALPSHYRVIGDDGSVVSIERKHARLVDGTYPETAAS